MLAQFLKSFRILTTDKVGLKILDGSPQNDFYAIEFISEYGLIPMPFVRYFVF